MKNLYLLVIYNVDGDVPLVYLLSGLRFLSVYQHTGYIVKHFPMGQKQGLYCQNKLMKLILKSMKAVP